MLQPCTPEQFHDVVCSFRELLEAEHALSTREWLSTVGATLASLISYAMRLPVLDAVDGVRLVPPPAKLALSLPAEADRYWVVFDATQREEPVQGSVSGDLRDIYVDLGRGLAHFDRGDRDRAVFEWRCGYNDHWGRHAVGALRAIYCYLNA